MKLFISYARVDRPLCKQIADHLEDIYDVWYDKKLLGGQDWRNEIFKQLADSEIFVYLLSPESVSSPHCQEELSVAQELDIRLLPVLIQARTSIPENLLHIQYTDLSEGIGDMVELMKSLIVLERKSPSPNEQLRETGEPKKELTGRPLARKTFWTQLLEKSKPMTPLFSRVSPRDDHWLPTGAGKTGVFFIYTILKPRAIVEVYIDTEDKARNTTIFDHLQADQAVIEAEFGNSLTWQLVDDRRACRIMYSVEGLGGIDARENWGALQDVMIDKMMRLADAFRPHIAELRI
jgi:hypothetical protein